MSDESDGSSSYATSGGFTRTAVRSVVEPWIVRDMEKQQIADVEPLIGAFLSDPMIMTNDREANIALFNECRETVTSLWSEKRSLKSSITTSLKEYCKQGSEKARYEHFVTAANEALKMMRPLMIPGSRANNGLGILFHRNDVDICEDHGNPVVQTQRQPDIIATSMHSARRAAGAMETETWAQIAFKRAPGEPASRFQWYDILSAVELQCIAEIDEKDVDAYRDDQRAMITVPPHFVNMGPNSKKRSMCSVSTLSAAGCSAKRIKSETGAFAASALPRRDRRHTNVRMVRENTVSPVRARQPTRLSPLSSGRSGASANVAASPPKIAQCGLYATEMLCGSYGVSHSINLFIVDCHLWIIYIDRQGCIQSRGFNFIKDLPTFFVLLLALQRLDLLGWGLNPTLDARVYRAHRGLLDSNDEGHTREPNEWQIRIDAKPVTIGREKLHSTLAMTGKGTVTVEGFTNYAGQSQRLAVKMYWPEAHRPNESMFIYHARMIARGDSDITNHLPTVFASQDFYDTFPIRLAVGLRVGKPRVLRVIAFAYLEPITKLPKHKFVRAWLDCVRCHFKLWQLGFQHRDPSLSNIMINPSTKRGVLNDWDLSYDSNSGDDEGHVGGERTGTLPFMALDLLTDQAWNGNVQRLYRHDLEGFIWVLPWVFLQFEDSVLTIPTLEKWQSGDYAECARAKRGLFSELQSKDIATESWKAEWELTASLLYWLLIEEGLRGHHSEAPPLSPKDVFNKFYDGLCIARRRYEPLEKLMHELKPASIE